MDRSSEQDSCEPEAVLTRRSLIVAAVAVVLAAVTSCGGGGVSGTPDSLLEEGWRAYSTGDWDVVVEAFEAVEKAASVSDEQILSARLGLASTYHYGTNPDLSKAAAYYSGLNSLGTDTAQRLGMLGVAQVQRAEGNRTAALESFERVRTQYPDTLEADEATIHVAEILFEPVPDKDQVGGFALPTQRAISQGLGMLEAWLEHRPDSPLAPTVHRLIASRYLVSKDYRAVVDHLQTALEKGVVSAQTVSSTLWQIARIAELELKDYALAEHYYERFVKEARRNALYYRATLSLERVRRLKAEQAG